MVGVNIFSSSFSFIVGGTGEVNLRLEPGDIGVGDIDGDLVSADVIGGTGNGMDLFDDIVFMTNGLLEGNILFSDESYSISGSTMDGELASSLLFVAEREREYHFTYLISIKFINSYVLPGRSNSSSKSSPFSSDKSSSKLNPQKSPNESFESSLLSSSEFI
eukprot:371671_1